MRRLAIVLGVVVTGCGSGFALNPSLDMSQYSHDAWTVRSGFIKGNIYSMAQTADGYLWLGGEFGLVRFDGVRTTPWQAPAGQRPPTFFRLLAARDGTLWIGSFDGLFAWHGGKFTKRPELQGQVVGSLIEDREGTVWAGSWKGGPPPARLCAIRSGSARCYGEDGAFGSAVSSLYEDSSGTLWAGAQTGVWRWKPGPPKRYAAPSRELTALSEAGNGRLIVAMYHAGLAQIAGREFESYPVPGAIHSNRLLRDREIDSNKLLRDRDGGLWIGTVARGLIHIHHGRTDVFTKSDGLSGDIVLSLFEDREGNVWVATTGGLDRFRELPVRTVSVKQGLASDASHSVLAAADGSIWIGAHDALIRWKNGPTTIYRKVTGLPDHAAKSLSEDHRGRIWALTDRGLTWFKDGRSAVIATLPGLRTGFMTGDNTGNLWFSEDHALFRFRDGHFVERIPWSELGHRESAFVLLAGSEEGGLWLGFWRGGGLSQFRDRRLVASYTAADGLGKGAVTGLQLDSDGALWAATLEGGLSRVKDGRISTLTTRNGLPCDTIHWSVEDDDHSLWLYTGCGLVRIARTELDAWIADPKRTIQTTIWDAADGVRLRATAASSYGPRVAKATDGKLWFVTGEGVQVVDPHHLAVNRIPPPVHIERIIADHKIYWQNLAGAAVSDLHLPPLVRDLAIDYTALSLVAPEKVHFKYKLEGQDQDWKEVINDRQAQYTNLPPRQYRFRVIACNNSGVWNETGDVLGFLIAPAYYQTNWFRALWAAVFLALLWMAHKLRVRRLQREYNIRVEERVEERMRIARELHDTLLQSFHGLLLRLQGACNLLPGRAPEARQVLEGAIDDAARAVTEAREAVEGLRANPMLDTDLIEAIKALGQELASQQQSLESAAPAFSVVVEGQPRGVDAARRDEVYRVASQALRNAFQHARAHRIEAEIRYDASQLLLCVRDDGIGIEPEVLDHEGRAGHWGLKGMRERARRIGAQLEVWSEHGAGTEVELIVPASIAYADGGRRRGSWLRKRKRVQQS